MNKKVIIGSGILALLIVAGGLWIIGGDEEVNEKSENVDVTYCEIDSDCVKVEIGCCPCNMGGQETCINKEFENDYLNKNCSITTICAAVFNCEIESCRCVEGVCVGQ